MTPLAELRHYTLPIGAVVLVVGSVLFVLSLIAGWLGMPDTVGFYVDTLPRHQGAWQGWNTLIFISSPLLMIGGGWYVYEQISLRNRFDDLVTTKKKSDFRKEVAELERISRRLPPRYRQRLKERKEEFDL